MLYLGEGGVGIGLTTLVDSSPCILIKRGLASLAGSSIAWKWARASVSTSRAIGSVAIGSTRYNQVTQTQTNRTTNLAWLALTPMKIAEWARYQMTIRSSSLLTLPTKICYFCLWPKQTISWWISQIGATRGYQYLVGENAWHAGRQLPI